MYPEREYVLSDGEMRNSLDRIARALENLGYEGVAVRDQMQDFRRCLPAGIDANFSLPAYRTLRERLAEQRRLLNGVTVLNDRQWDDGTAYAVVAEITRRIRVLEAAAACMKDEEPAE